MTNADKIRNMSDEELAETYVDFFCYGGVLNQAIAYKTKHTHQAFSEEKYAIKAELEWLKSEVEE